MKFNLRREGQSDPFLVLEADSRYDVPSSISEGTAQGMTGKGYAQRLAKGAASVMAIASRMGRDVVVEPEGEEPSLDEMVAKARGERSEGAVDLTADGTIVKTADDQRIVFGWAYVTHDQQGNVNIDKSGDFIDQIEEIEKSAYDFVLKSRASDADHTNVKGGEMVESIVFTPDKIAKMGIPEGVVPMGWWVGFKIGDEGTWARVKKGELRAFSIHGSGTRSKVAEN